MTYIGTKYCLPDSLWKGDLGIAARLEDLAHPDTAAMPAFDREAGPAAGANGGAPPHRPG